MLAPSPHNHDVQAAALSLAQGPKDVLMVHRYPSVETSERTRPPKAQDFTKISEVCFLKVINLKESRLYM